jgi:hypothetical protein
LELDLVGMALFTPLRADSSSIELALGTQAVEVGSDRPGQRVFSGAGVWEAGAPCLTLTDRRSFQRTDEL